MMKSPSANSLRHRVHVYKEIVETEREYVRSLEIIVKVRTWAWEAVFLFCLSDVCLLPQKFLGPIRQQKLLSAEDQLNVFANVELLYAVHVDVLKKLEERWEKWPSAHMADVLVEMVCVRACGVCVC